MAFSHSPDRHGWLVFIINIHELGSSRDLCDFLAQHCVSPALKLIIIHWICRHRSCTAHTKVQSRRSRALKRRVNASEYVGMRLWKLIRPCEWGKDMRLHLTMTCKVCAVLRHTLYYCCDFAFLNGRWRVNFVSSQFGQVCMCVEKCREYAVLHNWWTHSIWSWVGQT